MQYSKQQLQQFWSKVDRKDRCSCWEWKASRKGTRKGSGGYGQIKIAGRHRLAHRVAFAMVHGKEAEGLVMHCCDNVACVNPSHLKEGTHQENMDDMKSKGRQGKKLTAEIALLIRDAQGTGTQREVADRFGVSHRTIGHIWSRQTWNTI